MLKVKIKKLKSNAIVPGYAHHNDAGVDFFSCEKYFLKPGERALVSTGIAIEFSDGYELQIRPRSGLAIKKGIGILNSPGTIDAGYRGEIGIILINYSQENFEINPGDKIAQGVFNKFEKAEIEIVEELNGTSREQKGFGSSGN